MIKKLLEKYKAMPVQAHTAFWFLICSFMQKGISSITTPIFTRLLTTAEYGQYSVFNSWLSIITIFVCLQLYSGVYMQGLVKFEKDRDRYSSSLQGLTLVLVLFWLIIYLLFRDFWNNLLSLTTVQMLAMLLMIWSTAAFNFWASYQRVDFKYHKLVLVTVLVSIAKPVVGIIFVIYSDDKVTARILGLALVEVISYTGLFVSQMRKGKVFFHWSFWKHALLFNIPLIPHYLSVNILSIADRIMISKMVGDNEAGIYSLAYSVSQIMFIFNTALTQTLEPWRYKKLRSGRPEDLAKIAYPTLSLIAGLNILLMAFAPEVIAIFAPVEYHDAVWVIPPVSMSLYFTFSYGYFAVFEFFFEKTQYTMIATTVGAVLNIVLNYFFIGLFGYKAAGYTTLICYMVYSGSHYYLMKKISKEKFPNRQIYNMRILLTITFVFMLIGFLLLATYAYPVLRYSIIFVILVIIFIKRHFIIDVINQLLYIRKESK